MLLCDIGNTSYHFSNEMQTYKRTVTTFNPADIQEKVYYISVNAEVSLILETLDNWINIAKYIDINQYYKTIGIDRVCAMQTVSNTVVVDAGSAITVDVIKDGKYEGGFIYPGILAMQKTFVNISSMLDYSFNFDLDLDIMPKNSQDAISYGFLKTLYSEVMSYNLPIVLTGGDGHSFKKIFKNATVDEELIFRGMKHLIKKADKC